MRLSETGRKGFTLVELIIVIIILGILAALAIPQFTQSTTTARENTLKGNLAVLRTATGLYFHEHNSTYPGATKATDGSAATTDSAATTAVLTQFTMYTSVTGQTSATKTGAFTLGPYMLNGLPNNPINQATASTVLKATVSSTLTADGTSQFLMSTATGQIIANVAGNDSNGVAYSTY